MRSLRFRLSLWFSFAVTITAASAAWIGYLVVKKQMLDGIDFLLDAEIQEIVQRLGPDPAAQDPAVLLDTLSGHAEIDAPLYYFQIHRIGRGIVFRSRNLGTIELPNLSDGGPMTRTILLDDEPVRVRERIHDDFHVQVATNLAQVEILIARYRHALVVALPILFAVSIGAGWWLATLAVRPVRAMQESARRITASNLSDRLPVPPGNDEIASLARLLNELFARLEAAFEQVKRFTADASHELKTPLSLIRLHAERLDQSPRLNQADRAEIDSQVEEINRLNRLVESLLLLARADAGGLPIDRRWQRTTAFVREMAEDAQALAEDRGRIFSVTRNEAAEARFDPVMIRHVVLNVLTNSLRQTPGGKRVMLASFVEGNDWHLSIEDEGPGVPEAQLGAIFERFVRGTGHSQEASSGSGLGLAIARSIVEAHGGTIWAANRAEGGLRVNVQLPEARLVTAVTAIG